MSFEPDLRKKIVREAATLLYLGIEKEYKQAKKKAAKTFGSRSLPSNIEIALELDIISEEREGENRNTNLVKMRKESLRIMKILLQSYADLRLQMEQVLKKILNWLLVQMKVIF